MKQESFTLPQMHELAQVMTVARALRAIPGVVDVLASATFRQVVVQYDSRLTSAAAIGHYLTAMGFAPVQEASSVGRPDEERLALSN